MSFKPAIIADSSGKFCTNNLAFATKEEAEASARELMNRWFSVTDYRAEESDQPVSHKFENGKNVPIRG